MSGYLRLEGSPRGSHPGSRFNRKAKLAQILQSVEFVSGSSSTSSCWSVSRCAVRVALRLYLPVDKVRTGGGGGRGASRRAGDHIQNGRRFGRDSFTVCNVSPTSPPLCHTTPPISRCPPPARGPRLFVCGCLDAWLTASD